MTTNSDKPHAGKGHRPERRISVRGVRRAEPDMRKLAQALIALAQAQAETEARAAHEIGNHVSAANATDTAEDSDADSAAILDITQTPTVEGGV
jgi:hypothetical protein